MQHPKYETWPYKKVLPEHIQPLIDRYQGGESARKICLDFPFAEDVALKVLRDFDIPIKTRKEIRFSMGHSFNESAFSDTNEQECAYFYGWLLTDGNIKETKYGHQVSIELGLKDIEIVESLKSYIGNGNSIRVRHRTDIRQDKIYSQCSFAFQYEPVTNKLMDLGLEPRKSKKEICPDAFLYNRHFWRGVLEGDGYLSKIGADNKMQICGSETLCNQWKDYCQSIVPDMYVNVYEQKNGLYNCYSGKMLECKAVLDSLYLNTSKELRLSRKYNIYVERFYDGIDPNYN
jgi:hypothetical protein